SLLIKAEEPQHSQFILVDQFGYLPASIKTAVIRNPQLGYDSTLTYTPGNNYAIIDSKSNEQVFTGNPVLWKNRTTDSSSGDKAWWFDFSAVSEPGSYYVLDVDSNFRSYEF